MIFYWAPCKMYTSIWVSSIEMESESGRVGGGGGYRFIKNLDKKKKPNPKRVLVMSNFAKNGGKA